MTRRLLFLSPQPPWPLVSGSTIRNYHLLRQLADRGWRISLFSLVRDGIPVAERLPQLEAICEAVRMEPFAVARPVQLARVAVDVVTQSAYHRHFYWSDQAAQGLHDFMRAASYDAVLFGILPTFSYVPREFYARTVFDSHNAEFLRLGTMSASQPLLSRGLVARVQRRTVRRYEADVVRSVAATLAVSEEERRYFDELAPGRVRLAPNGVDVEGLRPRGGLPGEPRFLFMGSLSYSANLDALKYLVSDILPKLKRRDALLTIVGSRPPASVAAIAQRSPIATHLAGFVPETRPYVEANRFLVVPLRVGGGTRIKILDALAQGLPVITTTVGCAGLKVEHLRDVVVADDPADFARWIDRLLEDDELAGRLAERGRQTVERHYGWKDIGAKVHEALVETSERGVLLPPTNAVETASR